MANFIGVDLGTTKSVVSIMEGGEPTVIPTAVGGRLCPSVVAFPKADERRVGQMARRQAVVNPDNTVGFSWTVDVNDLWWDGNDMSGAYAGDNGRLTANDPTGRAWWRKVLRPYGIAVGHSVLRRCGV